MEDLTEKLKALASTDIFKDGKDAGDVRRATRSTSTTRR